MLNGNNIIIKLNGYAVAKSTSCEIETNCDTIEATSSTSGRWKRHITTYKSWTVNVNYLVLSDVKGKLLSPGTSYTLNIEVRDSNSDKLTGTAIMKTCKITATRGNLVQGTFQFLGTEALTTVSSS